MKKFPSSPFVSQDFPSKKPRFEPCMPRSETCPSSAGPAGGVSPVYSPPSPSWGPGDSESDRLFDEWGDTFVPETPPDLAGDVAAGEAEAACSSAVDGNLSGQTLIAEEKEQELWEAKLHQMLARMRAKSERQKAERDAAALVVEREEKEWDAKIDGMLARMKAKDLKSKASVNSDL